MILYCFVGVVVGPLYDNRDRKRSSRWFHPWPANLIGHGWN
jgi:hypothetical protein